MKTLVCIGCPNGCELSVEEKANDILVSGNMCPKGKEFAINEIKNPVRSVTSTVKTVYEEVPRLSVRTNGEIPIKYVFPLMKLINTVEVDHPAKRGEVILKDVFHTGVDVIATSDMNYMLRGVK
ncbi:MAG TPA: molybdopterin oxidoreductase [Clostridiaceae bacterium]|nr:molybdopterin oxidoreductase [Clostridiaceae bacterium]HBG39595.1 molybdopterin oxidoreductase [Clostridiaceae bacterium]HBN29235.1 molybdopterin oxidoreductase [Clostridiaceae bacterium]HBX47553.1 molybdopterin oxidoreductase [Clostridiaceae bacterium]HCL50883.1 molybdopterin oxidoreductase [Clostridiaceae bacterium]